MCGMLLKRNNTINMRNKIITLCLAAFTTVGSKAQTIEFIEPRNVQNIPEASFSTYKAGDYFYVLQKKFRVMAPVMYDLQLDAYDANRKPIGSAIIDKSLEMGDANIFQGVYGLKDKLVMFKSEYSKATGSKMSYLYYYPFDVNGKRLKKNTVVTINAESAGNSGNFGLHVSPDGSKIVVISELPFEKEGMERCAVTVFDEQFKQIWKKEYIFPYESARAPKNEVMVNNQGVVFILKRVPVKKSHDQFSIFTFPDNGKTAVEKKIELDNGFTVSSSQHLFTATGDLQLAGFYYINKKVGINVETPDGTFFAEVKAANGDLTAVKSNKVRSAGIKATQLLRTADNGFILVGETVIEKSTPKAGAAFDYTYEYKTGYNHIIKLGGNGILQWDYELRRDLRSASDGGRFLGSYCWVNGNDVNVLFTDELSKHDNKRQFIEFGTRWINLYQTIGSDGNLKNETVISDPRIGGKKGEYIFMPVTGSLYKDNKLFMLAARGLELVGATISY
jgi:hypothetical protein